MSIETSQSPNRRICPHWKGKLKYALLIFTILTNGCSPRKKVPVKAFSPCGVECPDDLTGNKYPKNPQESPDVTTTYNKNCFQRTTPSTGVVDTVARRNITYCYGSNADLLGNCDTLSNAWEELEPKQKKTLLRKRRGYDGMGDPPPILAKFFTETDLPHNTCIIIDVVEDDIEPYLVLTLYAPTELYMPTLYNTAQDELETAGETVDDALQYEIGQLESMINAICPDYEDYSVQQQAMADTTISEMVSFAEQNFTSAIQKREKTIASVLDSCGVVGNYKAINATVAASAEELSTLIETHKEGCEVSYTYTEAKEKQEEASCTSVAGTSITFDVTNCSGSCTIIVRDATGSRQLVKKKFDQVPNAWNVKDNLPSGAQGTFAVQIFVGGGQESRLVTLP